MNIFPSDNNKRVGLVSNKTLDNMFPCIITLSGASKLTTCSPLKTNLSDKRNHNYYFFFLTKQLDLSLKVNVRVCTAIVFFINHLLSATVHVNGGVLV